MTGLEPLIALWLFSKSRDTTPSAVPGVPAVPAPPWPTTSSPPPMPVFRAAPTPAPSADPGRSSTPLADLHKSPPKLAPASATQPGNLKQQAATAAKTAALNTLRQQIRTSPLNPIDPWGSPTTSVPVAKLQEIVNNRGGNLKRDGLYGPKTAAAWSKLTTSKGYPGTISRVNAKTAKVVSRTYQAFAVPPIP